MKRVTKFFRSFYARHIAAWPEQGYPYTSLIPPATDLTVLRRSVSRYFKYNEDGLAYRVKYAPDYEQAIDGLRKDGWFILLESDESGFLYYAIYNIRQSCE